MINNLHIITHPHLYCILFDYLSSLIKKSKFSVFREEISACAAVHMPYVMNVCDLVGSTNLLPPMIWTSFVLIELTWLVVNEIKH